MENDIFEKYPIHKSYMKLAMPVVLSMVIQLVYNMVDTYFISLTHNNALIAGVSVCTPLFTLMLTFGDMFGLGGSSVISRMLGAGDRANVTRVSTFTFYMSLAFGVLVAILMTIFTGPMLNFLGADSSTLSYAGDYYKWLIYGAPFIIFSFVPTNQLRAMGHPNVSMFISVLGVVVNIVLDPVFIFSLNLGAAGAAIATVIGYIVSDLVAVIYILRKSELMSFSLKNLSFTKSIILPVFAIGIPASVTNLMQTIGITLTNRSLRPYSSDAIAAMGIVLKIVNIVMLIIVGLAFGGQPLIGYTYGSGNMKKFKDVLRFAIKAVCGTALVMAIAVFALAGPLVGAFLKKGDAYDMGVTMLRLQMPGMILMGLGLVAIVTFQSMGKGLPALILSLCRQGVIYALVLLVMTALLGYNGVVSAQLGADIVTTFIVLILGKIYISPNLKQFT